MDSSDNAIHMILFTLALLLAASIIIWILHRAEKHRRRYDAIYKSCNAAGSFSNDSTPNIIDQENRYAESDNPANDDQSAGAGNSKNGLTQNIST